MQWSWGNRPVLSDCCLYPRFLPCLLVLGITSLCAVDLTRPRPWRDSALFSHLSHLLKESALHLLKADWSLAHFYFFLSWNHWVNVYFMVNLSLRWKCECFPRLAISNLSLWPILPLIFFKSYFNSNQLEIMAIIFYVVFSFPALQER